jgi:hypothetical protein
MKWRRRMLRPKKATTRMKSSMTMTMLRKPGRSMSSTRARKRLKRWKGRRLNFTNKNKKEPRGPNQRKHTRLNSRSLHNVPLHTPRKTELQILSQLRNQQLL